jgi:hypothetical protein
MSAFDELMQEAQGSGKPVKAFDSLMAEANGETPEYRSIPEQAVRGTGLTGRHIVEGLSETADALGGGISRRLLQRTPGLVYNPESDLPGNLSMGYPNEDRFQQTFREGATEALDNAGMPSPETPNEELVGTAVRTMAGALPFAGAGMLLQNATGAVTRGVGSVLSSEPKIQAAAAAAAGAASEKAKQEGYDTTVQILAALTAGMAPSAAKGLAVRAGKILTPMPVEVNRRLSQYDLKGIPLTVVENLRKRVQSALDDGGVVDEEQLGRLIAYAKTNTRPTRASISQDPIDITRQKNLAGMGANTSNPDLQLLARVENDNAKALIAGLDDIAKGTQLDLKTASSAVIGSVKARDSWLNKFKNSLYRKAEETHGRQIVLDRDGFAKDVYAGLKENRRLAFLPKKVRSIIDDSETPFTVDEMDTLETIISTEIATARRAGKGNIVMALKTAQKALRNIKPTEELGAESIKAFRNARAFNFKLAQWRDKSPAIKAIVDGVEPDKFMEDFVIGGTAKASDKSVTRLMVELKKDPEVAAIVKNQVAAWIKDQAQNKNPDEAVRITHSALRNALRKIGDNKLKVLFGKEDFAQLKNIERVLMLEQNQPIGSAVNNSKTAVTGLGQFAEWMESIANYLPYGRSLIQPITRTMSQGAEGHAALTPTLGPVAQRFGTPATAPIAAAVAPPATEDGRTADQWWNKWSSQ